MGQSDTQDVLVALQNCYPADNANKLPFRRITLGWSVGGDGVTVSATFMHNSMTKYSYSLKLNCYALADGNTMF